MGLILVSGQVCDKSLLSIAPMVVHALEFGDYSAFWYHKIYFISTNWYIKTFWGLKVNSHQYILHLTLRVKLFFGVL